MSSDDTDPSPTPSESEEQAGEEADQADDPSTYFPPDFDLSELDDYDDAYSDDDDEDAPPTTVLSLPNDMFLHEIFPFLKVITLITKIIFVSKTFHSLAHSSLSHRRVHLHPAVLERIRKWPNEGLLERLFLDNVVVKAKLRWFGFFLRSGMDGLFFKLWSEINEWEEWQVLGGEISGEIVEKRVVVSDSDAIRVREGEGSEARRKEFVMNLFRRAATYGRDGPWNFLLEKIRERYGDAHRFRDEMKYVLQDAICRAIQCGNKEIIRKICYDPVWGSIVQRHRFASALCILESKKGQELAEEIVELILASDEEEGWDSSVVREWISVKGEERTWGECSLSAMVKTSPKMEWGLKRLIQERKRKGWLAPRGTRGSEGEDDWRFVSSQEAFRILKESLSGSPSEAIFFYALHELKADPVFGGKTDLLRLALNIPFAARALREMEDIDWWVDHGSLFLDACNAGSLESVVDLLSRSPKMKDRIPLMSRGLVHVCGQQCLSDYSLVSYLLNETAADPTYASLPSRHSHNQVVALHRAVDHRSIEAVKLLLADPRVDPSADSSIILKIACETGNREIIRLLLEDSRANPNDQNLMKDFAVKNLDLELLQLLLEDGRSDPTYERFHAVRVIHKHTEGLDKELAARATAFLGVLLADERMHAFFQPAGL